MHPLLKAYWEGRKAYPQEPNPYDDHNHAHMWRLGWTYTRDNPDKTREPHQ